MTARKRKAEDELPRGASDDDEDVNVASKYAAGLKKRRGAVDPASVDEVAAAANAHANKSGPDVEAPAPAGSVELASHKDRSATPQRAPRPGTPLTTSARRARGLRPRAVSEVPAREHDAALTTEERTEAATAKATISSPVQASSAAPADCGTEKTSSTAGPTVVSSGSAAQTNSGAPPAPFAGLLSGAAGRFPVMASFESEYLARNRGAAVPFGDLRRTAESGAATGPSAPADGTPRPFSLLGTLPGGFSQLAALGSSKGGLFEGLAAGATAATEAQEDAGEDGPGPDQPLDDTFAMAALRSAPRVQEVQDSDVADVFGTGRAKIYQFEAAEKKWVPAVSGTAVVRAVRRDPKSSGATEGSAPSKPEEADAAQDAPAASAAAAPAASAVADSSTSVTEGTAGEPATAEDASRYSVMQLIVRTEMKIVVFDATMLPVTVVADEKTRRIFCTVIPHVVGGAAIDGEKEPKRVLIRTSAEAFAPLHEAVTRASRIAGLLLEHAT
eukprot:TRINITY_DN4404_c0_g1_i1.p1 TRINITY_DN4404_c0_g1~~TRINITY_DN4404_c0_g1_i1.p1  ORF type:complete len:502 (+),score=77.21 TRINITY_DN4404_c0_g1_i1:68-1573(+)